MQYIAIEQETGAGFPVKIHDIGIYEGVRGVATGTKGQETTIIFV
jgi:hypothetical protein